MTMTDVGRARAVADLSEGTVLATVEVGAPVGRVFDAIASSDVVRWWVRPGVFDTRTWEGEVRVGGRWEASGVGNGNPYALEGTFTEVDRPRRLVHTWQGVGAPGVPTTVAYRVEELDGGGTRITLTHAGFTSREVCANTCIGWETSFERLADLIASDDLPTHG
jgi:uncharacterized protein YndB with AHSA1/START domain